MITLEFCSLPCLHTTRSHTVIASPPERIKWSPILYLHSINNMVCGWASIPSTEARVLKSTVRSHIQKQYVSVYRSKTRSHLAASCSDYLETVFFQGVRIRQFCLQFQILLSASCSDELCCRNFQGKIKRLCGRGPWWPPAAALQW